MCGASVTPSDSVSGCMDDARRDWQCGERILRSLSLSRASRDDILQLERLGSQAESPSLRSGLTKYC